MLFRSVCFSDDSEVVASFWSNRSQLIDYGIDYFCPIVYNDLSAGVFHHRKGLLSIGGAQTVEDGQTLFCQMIVGWTSRHRQELQK